MSVETHAPPRRQLARRGSMTGLACTTCPVCGTDECLLLEELGTYCGTMAAAQLAAGDDLRPPEREAGEAA